MKNLLTFFMMYLVVIQSRISESQKNVQKLIDLYKRKQQLLSLISKNINAQLLQQGQTINIGYNSALQMYQLNWEKDGISKYIPPHFIANNQKLQDLYGISKSFKIPGQIINVDRYQITSKIKQGIVVTKLREQIIQKKFNIQIKNSEFKKIWHRAYQFEDRLLQWKDNQLYFYQENFQHKYSFKSTLLAIFPINQYKISYVTRYQCGVLNTRTFQATTQYYFQSIAQASVKVQNSIYVLLKNSTLLQIENQKLLNKKNLARDIVPQSTQIAYIFPYILLYSYKSSCISIFDIQTSKKITFIKKVCIPNLKNNQNIVQMTFFAFQQVLRLLIVIDQSPGTSKVDEQKYKSLQFELFLKVKQPSKQTSLPYKPFLVIITITGVIYLKNRWNRSQKAGNKPKVDIRKNKDKFNEIDQYLSKIREKNPKKCSNLKKQN